MAHDTISFTTRGGVAVVRHTRSVGLDLLDSYAERLDRQVGGILTSGVDYPGRYSRWHLGYLDPCVEITARGDQLGVRALTDRGGVLLPAISAAVAPCGDLVGHPDGSFTLSVTRSERIFAEEERSRQPSVFTALRALVGLFGSPEEGHLGLYGAFGYDLAFQFEALTLRHDRPGGQRDLVLHLPDEILVIDRVRDHQVLHSYEFTVGPASTDGMARSPVFGPPAADPAPVPPPPVRGHYASMVRLARESFSRGDLFEVVPSQSFHAECPSPAAFFRRLSRANPAPYGFLFNLGAGEHLVGASPEMFVRVDGDRVETCPIAGTVARGADALEDAANIQELLDSAKSEAELTMCTDVDRNDKARVCVPGSVRVIGRRQIEIYSRLIHTVDHVEGRLRPGFDGFDAFLTHTWAVTVTGAPKRWAMQFIEDHETGPRRWYGGAVGVLRFDGSVNTGLMLRTAQIRAGVAEVRAGATLLFDSDPDAEELETELKASALLDAARGDFPAASVAVSDPPDPGPAAAPPRVLLVDFEDSFVHTLGYYLREHGAEVRTMRWGFPAELLDQYAPDLVVLSPGPGRPADFGCERLLDALTERGLPVFGVCLGMQALVEHHGGRLALLGEPVHGKSSTVRLAGGGMFTGVTSEITVGRYHSLYADPAHLPPGLTVTATADDGVIMAVEHQRYPHWGVQFHPESIMTLRDRAGHRIVANVLGLARDAGRTPALDPLG
ncbi:MAG TPA: anthranilate synthase component I [Mycobacteriales bacterium]|nr:anthranilate synthase component I [Mycobacteriales bacterium]